ncbi:MAG: hypothetical protein EKK29_21990 [Hyphomicrobiales bacterium]|nr:MAG: hypothetical protein EKK29_21990 [Hyphomicrobiales bacterium]
MIGPPLSKGSATPQFPQSEGIEMHHTEKKILSGMILLAFAALGLSVSSLAEDKKGIQEDSAVVRTRQHVKMLDELFKNVIVLVDKTYVKAPSDVSAAAAGKAIFATMKKSGWYDVRLLGLTEAVGDADDLPADLFERTAAKKLREGESYYEELSEKDGKRYLRVATGVPVVSENCVMCHANFKGDKGNIGALSYTVPLMK